MRISFRTADGPVLAVNGVSLSLRDSEVLAIVGESGSGKTVTGLSVLGLEPPGARVTGRIWFRDEELRGASPRRLRDIRGASIAMIFQEPMTSLNPVDDRRPPGRRGAPQAPGAVRRKARARVLELFDLVRMPIAATVPARLPAPAVRRDAAAGDDRDGRRLRPGAADRRRADHARSTSTIQAQILGLLSDLRTTLGMAVLLITHDLGVVSRHGRPGDRDVRRARA